MYFKEKENTNIDEEFREEKKTNTQKSKILILIIVGLLAIFAVIFVVSLNKSSHSNEELTYTLSLQGDRNVIITLGNDYIEAGYDAYDSNGNNLTSEVKVNSNVKTNEIGNYEISYTVGDKTEIRYIEIKEQSQETYIYLKGNKNIYLELNEEYKEAGFVSHDTLDGSLTHKVKVTGKVDVKKKGLYKIVYSVTNSRNITTQVERNVIVGENKP